MISRTWIAALLLLLAPAAAVAEEIPGGHLRVTYIGNEGFLLESAKGKVLIDALYRRGVKGYVVLPEPRRAKLESATAPFDGVDLVLASHYHADHYDAGAMAAHLAANPRARFLSTPQAVEQLSKAAGYGSLEPRVRGIYPAEGERARAVYDGIVVQVLNLHHGRPTDVQNLGLLIEINGVKVLHVGDTSATPDDFQVNHLVEEKIDIAFLPEWLLREDGDVAKVTAGVGARLIVPMHIPPPEDPEGYMTSAGGFRKLTDGIATRFDNAVVFRQEMESRILP